jgi:hypothetical protein
MIDRLALFGAAASVAALVFIVELVRRRRLREDYALLWLATGLVLLVLSAYRPLLDGFAALIGVVTYPPAALFMAAIVFILLILLHFSTALTRMAREHKAVAQELALLRRELEEARAELAGRAAGPGRAAQHREDPA